MRIGQHFLIAIPIAILWIIITNQVNLASALLGYGVGVLMAILLTQGRVLPPVSFNNLPARILTFFVYTLRMSMAILRSGLDVTLRVLGVRPLQTGIIAVPVQCDDEKNLLYREIMAGLSAHSITITPGEMVVDYNEDFTVMYVHVLDVERSGPQVDGDQTERMKQFKRILGRD